MGIKIRKTDRCTSDDKRMHVPAIVTATCPKCGHKHERDFSEDDYFSYPALNRVFLMPCYCPECNHEWQEPVKIVVALEAVPSVRCHECGRPMKRDIRPDTVKYKDRTVEIQQPGWYCTSKRCGEVLFLGSDSDVSDRAFTRLMREVNGEGT